MPSSRRALSSWLEQSAKFLAAYYAKGAFTQPAHRPISGFGLFQRLSRRIRIRFLAEGGSPKAVYAPGSVPALYGGRTGLLNQATYCTIQNRKEAVQRRTSTARGRAAPHSP
jgi:hypothetical protein